MINSTIERETKHDFGHLISSEDSGDMKQCYLKEEKKSVKWNQDGEVCGVESQSVRFGNHSLISCCNQIPIETLLSVLKMDIYLTVHK